jgi:hypothetical protein
MDEVMLPTSQFMIIDSDDEDRAEKLRRARKIHAKRLREAFKNKTREEQEEMAREEVDLEVLRDQFLNEDELEVLLAFNDYL